MKRIFRFSFSLCLVLLPVVSYAQEEADTVKAQKSLSLGIDITGPVLYSINRSVYNFEGRIDYRLNYKYYIVLEPGFSSYNYEKYNYEYNSRGIYLRMGTDISLLAPVAAKINHFAGIGLRYGLSVFNQETPFISVENYWGEHTTSVEKNSVHSHFLELQGGVRTEVFKNVLIGWAVKLRALVYSSGKNRRKAVYIPGMGGTDKFLSPSISYYIIYRFPVGNVSAE